MVLIPCSGNGKEIGKNAAAILLLAAAAFAPSAWPAGQLCTMPNGVIIRMSTSGCPLGAVKEEPDDGRELPANQKPIVKKKEPQQDLKITIIPETRVTKGQDRTPEPKKERDLIAEANAVCIVLRSAGASTCEVDVNIFSASVIDATMATSPLEARMACLGIANHTRAPGSPFVGRGWELRIFSPMGSGTRPMAACNL